MERLPDSLEISCPESRICFKVETVTRTERASEGKSKLSSFTGHTNGVAFQWEHPSYAPIRLMLFKPDRPRVRLFKHPLRPLSGKATTAPEMWARVFAA
jgi:hypothetical protein